MRGYLPQKLKVCTTRPYSQRGKKTFALTTGNNITRFAICKIFENSHYTGLCTYTEFEKHNICGDFTNVSVIM